MGNWNAENEEIEELKRDRIKNETIERNWKQQVLHSKFVDWYENQFFWNPTANFLLKSLGWSNLKSNQIKLIKTHDIDINIMKYMLYET